MGVEFRRRRRRRRRLVEKHAISTPPRPRARRVSKVHNTLSLDSVERIFYTRIFIDCRRRRFLLQQISSPASSRYPRPFSLGRSFQFQDVPRRGGRAKCGGFMPDVPNFPPSCPHGDPPPPPQNISDREPYTMRTGVSLSARLYTYIYTHIIYVV